MFKAWGKRNKYGTAPKRVDRTKTRQPFLDDSDEESLASTTSVSSESEFESFSSGSDTSDDSGTKRKSSDDSGDSSESEEKVVSRNSRKRSSTSAKALKESSSDSDSDVGVPVRKMGKANKFKRIKTDEDTKQTDAKRKERQRKLAELVARRKQGVSRSRRRRASPQKSDSDENENDEPENSKEADDEEKEKKEKKEEEDEEEEVAAPTVVRSSDENSASEDDSLKDFIVDDEEGKGNKDDGDDAEKSDVLSQLPSQFITRSPLIHFQVVVKSLLINALDDNFLKSLYNGERTKRYALEMKDSLHYYDERLVLPRLENLKLRSRWKERYKDRVECYPEVRVKLTQSGRRCEACELDRTGRFSVVLSGQLYHAKTLQEDQFLPEDKQSFCVGSVCANRTEVYHALKHFKYHLFVGCRTVMEEHTKKEKDGDGEQGDEEEPVKETVKKVFASLLQNGWINEQYDSLQEHLNKADFFQEEKLD